MCGCLFVCSVCVCVRVDFEFAYIQNDKGEMLHCVVNPLPTFLSSVPKKQFTDGWVGAKKRRQKEKRQYNREG